MSPLKKNLEKTNRPYRKKYLFPESEVIKKAKQSSDRRIECKKRLIKKNSLKINADPLMVNPGKCRKDVVINLKKTGNIVELIEVLCPCGNKIEIACRYKEEE